MRKHNYVIGYPGESEKAWGKDFHGDPRAAELLTFVQAKKELGSLVPNYPRIIYKLVPVYIKSPKKRKK